MKKSVSFLTLVAFINIQLGLSNSFAAIPVMDYAAEATLGSILGTDEAILTNTSTIASNTTQIVKDTGQILQEDKKIQENTKQIKEDTTHMRNVLDSKQKLILAIGQLQALSQYGIAVSEDKVDEKMSKALVELIKNPKQAEKAIKNLTVSNSGSSSFGGLGGSTGGGSGSIPGTSSLSGAGNNWSGALSSMENMGGDDFSMPGGTNLGNFSSWANVSSLISNGGGNQIDGFSDSLNPSGGGFGNVTSMFNQSVQQIGQLTNVVGNVFAFAENTVGYNGVPLNFQQLPPSYMYPVSNNVAGQLGMLANNFQKGPNFNQVLDGLMDNLSPAGQIIDGAGQVLNGAAEITDAAKGLLGDGLYIRKLTPEDNAYYAMVQKGTARSTVAFYAANTNAYGSEYHPFSGYTKGKILNKNFNLNNTLSAGAYASVERFNKIHGHEGNPYSNFAKGLAPVLAKSYTGVVGKNYVPDMNMLRAARDASPIDFNKFPKITSYEYNSLDDGEKGVRKVFAMLENQIESQNRNILNPFAPAKTNKGFAMLDRLTPKFNTTVSYFPAQGAPAAGGQSGLILTLTNKEQQEYNAYMAAGNTRISQIAVMSSINSMMLQYSKKVLTAVNKLRDDLKQQADNMTEDNAIESIPMMIQNCSNMSVVMNQMCADYTIEIERLMETKDAVLRDQAKYNTSISNMLQRTASTRAANAALLAAGNNSSNSNYAEPGGQGGAAQQ